MIFLFGESSASKVKDSGEFYCAVCDARQRFQHIQIQTYATLFFISVLPLRTIADYVECDVCQANYAPQSLTESNVEEAECPIAASHCGMVRVLVYLLLGYGKTHARVRMLQDIYHERHKQTLSEVCIQRECDWILRSHEDILAMITHMAPALGYSARLQIMLAAQRFTQACSEMAFEDRLRLNQMSSRFEIRLN